jgi:hypothetical protein
MYCYVIKINIYRGINIVCTVFRGHGVRSKWLEGVNSLFKNLQQHLETID